MDKRYLLAGAAVVAVGAAFGGGYYLNRPAPQVVQQPAPSTEQTETPAPDTTAEDTTPAPSEAAPITSNPAPVERQAAAPKPTKPRAPTTTTTTPAQQSDNDEQYYADNTPPPRYRDDERMRPPPPPPPPPMPDVRERPAFAMQIATFPMHHNGAGTIASPATWTTQTSLGRGREADLTVALLVPEPGPRDDAGFWREWSNARDMMPRVTHGTPVIVAGRVSAVLAVDPENLNLRQPAALIVEARNGRQIYRSRDVAPARGAAWDSHGARWTFTPDANFFAMLGDGARVTLQVRGREDDLRIPFDTRDFARSARDFERDVTRRMPQVAAAWERVRPGAPKPLSPQGNAGNGPAPVSPIGNPKPGRPDRDHGGRGNNNGAPVPPVTNNPQSPATTPPATNPQPPQNGNGARDNKPGGKHGHDRGQGGANNNGGNAQAPTQGTPPAAPATPPAQPSQPPQSNPTPQQPAANAPSPAAQAALNGYRPPTEECGDKPAYAANDPGDYAGYNAAQLKAASASVRKMGQWVKCRATWLNTYQASVDELSAKLTSDGQPSRKALQGSAQGKTILADFNHAKDAVKAQKTAQEAQSSAIKSAEEKAAPADQTQTTPAPAATDDGGKPAKPRKHRNADQQPQTQQP